MDILKRPTLVLNKNWIPISTVTVERALKMLFGDWKDERGKPHAKARVLDIETWQLHEWDDEKNPDASWSRLPVKEGEPAIHGGCGQTFRVPEIIVVARYYRIPKNQLNFNRRNVIRRDNDTCQYCGDKGDSIDHVLPSSRGGATSWENCVWCCFKCNQRKANMTPEEADMKLMREPCKPGLEVLGQSQYRIKSWETFFGRDAATFTAQE